MSFIRQSTKFEEFLKDSFFLKTEYLSFVPHAIKQAEISMTKEIEEMIDKSDPENKTSIANFYYNNRSYEDLERMKDLFYKSYLITLCAFCEGFGHKIYSEMLKHEKINANDEKKTKFSKYWKSISDYVEEKFIYEGSEFEKAFELRNLVVHNNSRLKNISKNESRLQIANEMLKKYPSSLKLIDNQEIIICTKDFLEDLSSILLKELMDLLNKTETKLKREGIYIDPYC